MKKLSFSIPSSKSKSKPKPRPSQNQNEEQQEHADERKEYVTEFDPSKTRTQNQTPAPIIPPKENEYQPHKRMRNLHNLPSLQSSDDVRFEVESLDAQQNEAGNKMSYGLHVRGKQEQQELTGNNNSSVGRTEDVLLEKLRYDLKRLPEDKGFEEFEDMPVENFAKALLAGYGWHEGRGVGRNAEEDVKVKIYAKRSGSGMQGLGFSEDSNNNNDNRPGIPIPVSSKRVDNIDGKDDDIIKKERKQKERARKRMSAYSDDEGRIIGKHVRVIGGKRGDILGSKGIVVEQLNSDWLVLKLVKTDERVEVRVPDVADLGSKQDQKFLKEFKKLNIGQQETQRPSVSENRSSLKSERGVQWLRSHIRVRVISKELEGGRLYLKKGEVVDVVGPYMCDISMDESRELVQKVDQELLETALPRRGAPVLVLYGKHNGAYGNLVQKDLDREVGVVQDSGTHELLNVKLEQIAEYIGDPGYIGY